MSTSKKRDLQKLLALAQMDFRVDMSQKTRARIKNDLVKRFAENFVHRNDAESSRMKLERLQQHLAPVISFLRSDGIVEDFHFQSRLLKSEGKVVSFLHWDNHLLLNLIMLLNNLEENVLLNCPQCGSYFVQAEKKAKRYCSPRCTKKAQRQ